MFFQQRTTELIVMKLVLLLTIARRADGSLLLNLCLPPSLSLAHPLSLQLHGDDQHCETLTRTPNYGNGGEIFNGLSSI